MVIYDVVWDANPRIRRFKAAEDIEAGEAVYLSGTEEVSLTTNASCAGKAFAGVAVKSAPSGQYTSVAVPPTEVEVKASGAINAGSYVVPTANGAVKALQSETKATIAGYAITSASDNKVRIKLMDNYTPPQGEGLNAKGSYSAIVLKDDSTVWAEDKYGRTIAEGEAGVDDASVIQAAIDAVAAIGGGKVLIKEGVYLITTTIYMRDNLTLEGAGESSILKLARGANTYMIQISADNVELSNLVLDGNKVNQNPEVYGTLAAIEASGTNIIINRVHIHDSMGDGIEIGGENIIISHCIIHDGTEHEIHLHGVYNCTVINNILYNDEHQVLVFAHADNRNVVIANNIIHTGGSGHPLIDFYADSVDKIITIANNILFDGSCGIRVRYDSTQMPEPHQYINIIGNIILDISGTTGHAIYVENGYQINIQDNQIHNTDIGIQVSGSRNTINNNIIQYVLKQGIYVNAWRNQINSNHLVDCGRNGDYDAIYISSIKIIVTGNLIEKQSGTYSGRYGIYESSSSDENAIINNIVVDTALGGIRKVGANTIVKDNIGYLTENSGTATFSGDGVAADFLIGSHGLAQNPADPSKIVAYATPASADAIATSPCTVYASDEDADGYYESLRVKFASAPVAGTDNVVIAWRAILKS